MAAAREPSSWTQLSVERRSIGYCRVTFDHPPNDAITATTITELAELVGLIEQDDDLDVVVFHSANPAFHELLVRLTPGVRSRESTGARRISRRDARGMSAACTHLDQIRVVDPPEPIAGCEDCLAMGASWVHLRMCQICGRIGCCDSSPNRHATKHFHAVGHTIMRSVEPGEEWSWCYVDEVAFVLAEAGR